MQGSATSALQFQKALTPFHQDTQHRHLRLQRFYHQYIPMANTFFIHLLGLPAYQGYTLIPTLHLMSLQALSLEHGLAGWPIKEENGRGHRGFFRLSVFLWFFF